MVEAMSVYTVQYERDETGWWVAKVKEVRGCHTQGKSIAQARTRIREALGLFVHDADRAEFVEDVAVPKVAKTLVKEILNGRERIKQEEAKVRGSMRKAVHVLTSEVGISRRDAGELLGISYQRVQQILPEVSAGKKKKRASQ